MHSPAHYRRLRSNVRAFCKHGCKLRAASLLCPGPAAAFHGTGGLPARVPNAHCVLREVPGSELIELPCATLAKLPLRNVSTPLNRNAAARIFNSNKAP